VSTDRALPVHDATSVAEREADVRKASKNDVFAMLNKNNYRRYATMWCWSYTREGV
jgi:hypothetical protein